MEPSAASEARTSSPGRAAGGSLFVRIVHLAPSSLPRPAQRTSLAIRLFLVLTLFSGAGGEALANPFDNFGLGSRSAAMGSAMTAVADDFSASLYNPAGLVNADRMQISVGYFSADPALETFWAGAWRDSDQDRISGLVFGAVFPGFEIFGCRVVGGLGMHLPDKRVARSLMLPYDQPRFTLFGGSNQRTVIYSPNAIRITPWLALGAGFQLFIDTTGGPVFELIEDTPANEGKFSEGTISSSQKPRFFPFAGLLLGPWQGLQFGFSFRDRQEISLDIPMVVRIEPLTLGLVPGVPLLPASGINLVQPAQLFFSPRQFAFGLSWEPSDRLLLALDVTLMQWSDFAYPGPKGATYFSGGLEILLRQNPNFRPPEPDFHDIWVPAVGVEGAILRSRHLDLFLRVGYRYRPSPAPDQTGRGAYLDSDTHIVTAGLGLTFKNLLHRVMREPFSLDIHAQYFHLAERQVDRNLLVAISDRFGDLRFRGQVLSLGVTTTLRF